MLPEGFWDSTVREVLLVIKGHNQRELNEYRRLRLQRYDTYCVNTKIEERVSIYEYMPLDHDPTDEEVEELKKMSEEEMQKEYENAKLFYKAHGIEF